VPTRGEALHYWLTSSTILTCGSNVFPFYHPPIPITDMEKMDCDWAVAPHASLSLPPTTTAFVTSIGSRNLKVLFPALASRRERSLTGGNGLKIRGSWTDFESLEC
jgi:hypothetical protein